MRSLILLVYFTKLKTINIFKETYTSITASADYWSFTHNSKAKGPADREGGAQLIYAFLYPIDVSAYDYYGVPMGKLRNASYALDGNVYTVNSTHLQLVDFTLKRLIDRTQLSFVFENSKTQKRSPRILEYRISNEGDWLRAYEKELRDGVNNKRLIVEIPGSASEWDTFGIWSDTEVSWLGLLNSYVQMTAIFRFKPSPGCPNSDLPLLIDGERGDYTKATLQRKSLNVIVIVRK